MELKIYSPEETLVEATVENVTLPGVLGSFQVLKGHAALITALGAGPVKYTENGEVKTLPVSTGFAKVENDVVTVCIEQ